ncbi:OsmC-like protein [Phaeobacter sp. CECT 5382]|uniref:OsmC family protein n=1 Tax=Phaeobacter sp. CECT 5382 TaxID=1712645 RepID=UPI0006DAD5DC|nr:OsmC family protein [Phaeobacter sp. CECT 5382]CUH88856.1 OsmC-like protein [Phaeobacter sp. CECT 5382]
MKTRTLALMSAASLAALSTIAFAEEALVDHLVVTRIEGSAAPTALVPTAAAPRDGAITENVLSVSERILVPDNPMLKYTTVQPVGAEGFSAWQLASDEGGVEHEQLAPNPLSYLTSGISANLYTSLQRAAEVMDLSIDDMKVEVQVFYRYDVPGTRDWDGFTDKVIANILIVSDEPPEKLTELKEMALRGWVAGEGLANDTEIETALAVNGAHWEHKGAVPGNVPDPVSVDNGMTLSHKIPTPSPESFTLGKDLDMLIFQSAPDVVEFSVVAIVTSAGDAEQPYLQKINVRALQQGYTGWELFADDSYGATRTDKAPTSLDYLTAGTSHCLMTQLAAVPMALQLDIDDYRVEHQFNYRQDGFMTADMAGFTDNVQTRIVVNSSEPREALEEYFSLSLRACFAGDAFENKTPIETGFYVNGTVVE